ncbi:hypothetical protein F5B21DRAFT_496760 [Xylaria acuta]|nr:hypothetical protein F5B21DRAFT_496760 [Xylaria acuta]
MPLQPDMTVDTVEKKGAPAEPIEIHAKLVPLKNLIHFLREMLGAEKFMIEMRHDVYRIKSEKSINVEDLLGKCRSNASAPEMDLGDINSTTSVDLAEE